MAICYLSNKPLDITSSFGFQWSGMAALVFMGMPWIQFWSLEHWMCVLAMPLKHLAAGKKWWSMGLRHFSGPLKSLRLPYCYWENYIFWNAQHGPRHCCCRFKGPALKGTTDEALMLLSEVWWKNVCAKCVVFGNGQFLGKICSTAFCLWIRTIVWTVCGLWWHALWRRNGKRSNNPFRTIGIWIIYN